MTPLVFVMVLAAEPSAPPLVPIEQSVSEEQAVTAARAETPVDGEAPAPASRGRRMLGTAVGALVGDAITFGFWMVEMLLLSGVCGFSCFGSPVVPVILAAGTGLGIAPLGPFLGNRIAGGEAPYWKAVVGTAGGAILGVLLGFLFDAAGVFRGPGSEATVGAAISIASLQVVLGQVLATEIGAEP